MNVLMATGKMHVDEIDTDAGLVQRLLAAQFPQWAALPVAPLQSSGTDNALYRLGDDKVVRLPRIQAAKDKSTRRTAGCRCWPRS
jgi:aminoglycoside phosphotransferase (APT) family kinase protein